jgi:hypothetical protein
VRIALAAAALCIGLVAVVAADAAVAPAFTRSQARWGERVGVVQPVPIGKRAPGSRTGIVVYLIPFDRHRPLANYGWIQDGPPPARLAKIRLGELLVDRRGSWRLSFRVPHVRPGSYTTLVWCRPCGGTAYPHGSVFVGGYLGRNGVLRVSR